VSEAVSLHIIIELVSLALFGAVRVRLWAQSDYDVAVISTNVGVSSR